MSKTSRTSRIPFAAPPISVGARLLKRAAVHLSLAFAVSCLALPCRAGHYSGPVYDSPNGFCTFTSDGDFLSIPYQLLSDGSWGMGFTTGGAETNPNITCSGEITATFTWAPDGEGDNPPENILVSETCRARWFVQSDYGGSGSSDNALGFGEDPADDPPAYSGESSGTRYSVLPGTTTITLHCSPRATASSPMADDLEASVSYSAAAAPLDIILSGGIGPNYAKRYLIGQRVTATLDSAGLLIDPNTEQWSASGSAPFLNYVVAQDASSAVYTPMSPQTTSTFVFYFAGPPGQGSVTCTAHLIVPTGFLPVGGLDITVHRQCAVEAPTFDVLRTFGQTHIVQDGVNNLYMALSQLPAKPAGTDWNGWVMLPADFFGEDLGGWAYAQLWTPNRTRVNNGVNQHADINGITGVDTGFPYVGSFFTADHSSHLEGDMPQTLLDAFMTATTASDNFTTYMMFLPPGAGSVYVPLRSWSWSWVGSTSRPDTIKDWMSPPADASNMGPTTDYPPHPQWQVKHAQGAGNWVP